MTDHVDGARPRMPQLTDKELDDLYGFADNVENASRDLRHMLSTKFHAYRLAAFEADGGNEAAMKQEAVAEARGEASSSTPIARAVQEIIDLDEVFSAADTAHTDLGHQRSKAEPCRSPISDAEIETRNTMARYKAVHSAAFDRGELWKTLLLTMEPETLDDALSVLLVATGAIEELVDNHVAVENKESGFMHIPPEAGEIVRRINGALAAVIRSMTLHGGARSLLLDRFTGADDRIPWPERVKEARAAAAAVHARKEAEPAST
jgi:hypothetical protein